ncbi:MAG TPA: hypothetical protein VG406_09565 [Isosphaeraceae bacterium]|jgi:hypothetical protein|nr:hypothetical protein [Isosphaeraceae bacterium]
MPRRIVPLLTLALGLHVFSGAGVSAQTNTPLTMDRLVRMGPAELEALYRGAGVGAMPAGKVRGRAIVRPGQRIGPTLSRGARILWQGKVFRPEDATAVNRFFGVRAVRGQTSVGPSWLDGRPSLILDYSRTSLVYARVRDEIREVAPGLYLGLMYARSSPRPTFRMFFALEAHGRG